MIKITSLEQKIFDLLLETLTLNKLNITFRVAGGWVRDKLLGYESNDIDIALDTVMGKDFVKILHNHLIELNIESHGFGVIKKNAEQSKHLETATIQIYGLWIDFVNLRGEEYTNNSRIPTQIIGTPEQDAFRRDFTINSLFYNINEKKIEDFTKNGMIDLKNKIIRTPLCPRQTFLDDPLRILRGFRFSSRYDYKIEDKAYDYICKDKEIKMSFIQKISKERIGKEYEANFSTDISVNPFKFIDYLYKSNFLNLILEVDNKEKVNEGYLLAHKLNVFKGTFKDEFMYYFTENKDKMEIKYLLSMAYLSLLTSPFFDFNIKYLILKNNFCHCFIMNKLKLKRKAADFATNLLISLKELEKMYLEKRLNLKELAFWQRKSKSLWRLADKIFFKILYSPEKHGKYIDLNEYFQKNNLLTFFKTKHLLNGQEVKKNFKVKGKDIKEKMEEILIWQLYNPLLKKEDYIKTFQN